ncbi:MAG: flagellar FliJ family protein [Planctomycetaceae bacterium]|jgi:flagellar FliJ protein|nr:flagellar FliJ family protein [Planctomycetaceae bacterium]
MAFRFPLEPVIVIRDNFLKECQHELAKAYEARRIVEETEEKINSDLQSNFENGRRMLQEYGKLDVEYMLGLRRHDAYLNAQLNVVKHDLARIDEEIEKRQLAVTEAHKELKIIEKLKEKKLDEFYKNETKKEQIAMDEVAIIRKNREEKDVG